MHGAVGLAPAVPPYTGSAVLRAALLLHLCAFFQLCCPAHAWFGILLFNTCPSTPYLSTPAPAAPCRTLPVSTRLSTPASLQKAARDPSEHALP